jgi:Family of unknown function (DUF6502)
MAKDIQQTLSHSVLAILKPLVRILLRNGIAYGSFAELAKKVYVDVAFEDFSPDGKKQSISHVSAMTGLTRKEAKRLHELEQTDSNESKQRYNRAIRVISGWLNDAGFHDRRGKPAILPLDGDHASFAALVKKYSGDITPKAMLAVLKTAHSVEIKGDMVRLVAHAYIPGNDVVDKITILGTDTAELIATIDHNLVSSDDDLRFQRKVSNRYVRADAVPRFQALATKRSQALLEKFDSWLAENEIDPDDPDSNQGRYVSIGIYYYENSSDNEEQS